jgi:hypothetical protein
MNTHNKESVQQRLQMSYGHTEPYIVSRLETNGFNAGNKKFQAMKHFFQPINN